MTSKQSGGRMTALLGLVLVGLGALFLLGQFFNFNFWGLLWPFFVIVPGLALFAGMVLGGKPAGPLAVPGSIVTGVGLLLLYQTVTNHWESWAYAWALIFPTAVGVGLVINGLWSDVPHLVNTGRRWATVGMMLFAVGGLFFEVLLNISNSALGGLLWPALMIVFGAYLIVRRGSSGAAAPVERAPEGYTPVEVPPAEPVSEGHFEPLKGGRDR